MDIRTGATLFRVWTDRLVWWMVKPAQVAGILVYFKLYDWSWWYLTLLLFVPPIIWLEKKHIITGEQTYYAQRNEELMAIPRGPNATTQTVADKSLLPLVGRPTPQKRHD